ncbi:DUF1810 domain-containing protein [Chitinophaga agrisoli]|uniref:DUF1810 domain-containing protein n=1 Tax=Chitinophaga agrisoli TaxID=2607653 RepID=A0A5B2VVU3_9BACT|nr:DUF1810 domain-containing protein [Chitinophaga agrisoli]KAA2242698.1 DUF1810 domain-containing protein [Chitinophaga agrisoli]
MIEDLNRFIKAQESSYTAAYDEVLEGRKWGHWMWYIFPQFKGLGFSEMSSYYGIKDLEEAASYLNHPVLGQRLISICQALLTHYNKTAHEIFGSPDDLKLRSSMTLFASVEGADKCFQDVLDRFYLGEKDSKTLDLLQV